MESEIVFWMFGAPFALAMASVILVAGVVSVGQNAHGSRAADHFVLTACCAAVLPIVACGELVTALAASSRGSGYPLDFFRIVWLIGIGVVAARLLAGSLFVQGIIMLSEQAGPDEQDLFDRAAGHVGLREAPVVVYSRHVRGPLVTGLFLPVVVLPTELRAASSSVRMAVLTHEMGHIRRGDCLSQLVLQLAGALMWWNPLYWIASREIRTAREIVCDEGVSYAGLSRREYGAVLAHYAVKGTSPLGPGLASMHMAASGTLARRFEALAAHRPDDRGSALELLPERASCRQLLAYVGFVAALLCLLQAVFFLLDEQGPIMGL